MKFTRVALLAGLMAMMHLPASAETCIASVYGTKDKDQTGTRTASGIPLDDNKPSVAHRTRPLKSFVEIMHLGNKITQRLMVTDRGPYIKGRCIDLSHAAARLLGCSGLCRVQVRP